jgi:predicted CXXCH cytochrome family protein
MCASCHNTRLRKNYDEATDTYHTTMAEMSVGCESCHGPMKAHVEWRRQYPGSKEPDPTVKKLSRDQVADTCGSCHARRRELTGDFVPGDSFGQHYQLTTVDESDLYFADGQVRDELYEFGSFHGSKMYTAGVRCVDCHDPHQAKPRLLGDALCMRCHTGAPGQIPGSAVIAPVIDPAAHSFHPAESTDVSCVSCHMPVTTYMQRHPRHDHSFSIPDPLLTKQHGIPNACNRCHTDKDADWALAASEKWWGAKMNRPSRERAQRIAEARAGAPAAGEALLTLLRNEPNAYWKASLIRLLGAWSGDANVSRAFLEYAQHPDPLVRTASVQALAALANARNDPVTQVLTRRLEDPERCVRVAAASALRPSPDPASKAARELAHTLDIAADQPAGQLQKGVAAQARDDTAGALRHFEKAVSWDPNSGGIRHEYAILLSLLGRTQDALKEMQEAVRLEPRQAEFHFKLALAWNEVGNMQNAVKEFEETVRLDKRHARAWYNLGLAQNSLGKTNEAIQSLREAEAADPRDARIPYARATIHARLGQTAEAREAAQRALAIQPENQEARQLLQALGR